MLKAIIFDVGGVLIRTHSCAGREKWAKRLALDSWEFENVVFRSESGKQSELGQKSAEAHWQWLGQHFGLKAVEVAEMRHDFFAGDVLNEPLVAYARRLRAAGYRTGLLSNFGDDARRLWSEVYAFIDHFDSVTISSEVGLMKPDPRIYRRAAQKINVAAHETLFLDDFIENVEGAKRAGMQAIHYADPAEAQQHLVAITGVA